MHTHNCKPTFPTPGACVRETHFKKSVHAAGTAGKSESCRPGWQAEVLIKIDVAGLSQSPTGQQPGNAAGFLCCALQDNSFFWRVSGAGRAQSLLLRLQLIG